MQKLSIWKINNPCWRDPKGKGRVGKSKTKLKFDVVIATRNRPQALALSIPLILSQSRVPEKLIIIDSSDDHAVVAETVQDIVAKSHFRGDLIIQCSEKGASKQRNIGVRLATSDIVLLPDDDSLFYPNTSSEIMEAYEADIDGVVIGVCAADAQEPPENSFPDQTYRMTVSQKREKRFAIIRNKLERKLTKLNPYMYIGRLLANRHEVPMWLSDQNCVTVEFMAGYRMSFRRSVIAEIGFQEALGAYSRSEDVDACFTALRNGIILGARNALIYHHKFPTRRDTGYAMGASAVLSRTYIVSRHVRSDEFSCSEIDDARSKLRSYCRYKIALSALKSFRVYDREQLRGSIAAYREIDFLLDSSQEDLVNRYTSVRARLGLE